MRSATTVRIIIRVLPWCVPPRPPIPPPAHWLSPSHAVGLSHAGTDNDDDGVSESTYGDNMGVMGDGTLAFDTPEITATIHIFCFCLLKWPARRANSCLMPSLIAC